LGLPRAVHIVAGRESRLKGFEFPKAVHLEPEPFSIDNDLITPKMSLKRPQLLKHYKKQVGSAKNFMPWVGSLQKLHSYAAMQLVAARQI
jgi:hypothetical protein